jgi:hypothetical protein
MIGPFTGISHQRRITMNIIRLVLILSFIVLSTVNGTTGANEQEKTDRMQEDKVKAAQRVIEINELRNKLNDDQQLSQRFTTQLTGNEVILLEPTVYVTQDYSGDIRILGELQNVSSFDVSFVKITYTFKDSSNQWIDTDYTYVYGSSKKVSVVITDTVLTGGEVGSFNIYTSIPYDLVDTMYYAISFEDYETFPMGTTIVQNEDLTIQPDYAGDIELIGEVKNTGNEIAYFVKYVVTIKNSNNQVIDVDYSYINGRTVKLTSGITTDTGLYPNGIASFEIYTLTKYTEYDMLTHKINWDEGRVVPRPKVNITPLLPLVLE